MKIHRSAIAILVSFILLNISSARSQTAITDPNTGMAIYLGSRLYVPPKIDNHGVGILQTWFSPAPALGFRFQHDSKKWSNIGFSLSFEASTHSYHYRYDYTLEENNPLAVPDPYIDDHTITMFVPELTTGFSVYYRRLGNNKNHQFYLGLGVNSTLIPSFESAEGLATTIDSADVYLFNMILEHDNDAIYVTGKIEAGYEFRLLNRKNAVRIEYNIQRKAIYSGSYSFNIYPEVSYGNLKGTNSYFAVTYGFFFGKLNPS